MKRTYKIRCYPTRSQRRKFEQDTGTCRFVWNMFLDYIKEGFEIGEWRLSAFKFAKYINALKHDDEKYKFIKDTPEKMTTETIRNCYRVYQNYRKAIKSGNHNVGKPKYKSRKYSPIRSLYLTNFPEKGVRKKIRFIDNNHMIIPNYKKIKVKYRKRDIFNRPDTTEVISGRLVKDGNKYYICLIYNKEPVNIPKYNVNLGIDMGIEKYVTLYYSNETYYSHESILKDKRYIRIEEKIKKLQEIISHKQEINYQILLKEYKERHNEEPNKIKENIMKGVSFNTSNINKLRNKIRKLFIKRTDIVKDFINKLVNVILVRTKPMSITIETLSIRDMLENDSSHKLHDHIAKSNWYRFFQRLKNKCEEYMIQLRRANRYFTSSKICSNCGKKNKNLTLNDRAYICDECGLEIDRDLNAAINLCKLNKYTVVI